MKYKLLKQEFFICEGHGGALKLLKGFEVSNIQFKKECVYITVDSDTFCISEDKFRRLFRKKTNISKENYNE